MNNREDFRTIREYIEQKGGAKVEVEMNHKHPRMYLTYRGVRRFIVLNPNNVSDPRMLDNLKTNINNLFSYIVDVTPQFTEQKREEPKAPKLEVPETFGERLQLAREQQQLSRERLADLSGIDEDLIQRFEVTRQETLRDFTTALLLSSALNLSLAYLVGDQVSKEFKPMTAIGEAITRARTEAHIGLNDLARKAGVPVQRLASIETGLYKPDNQNIVRIAKALDLKKEDLIRNVPKEEIAQAPLPSPVPDQPKPIPYTAPSLATSYPHDDIQTGMDLAHFLRFLRQRKGLKQNAIAQALGMPYPGEISKVERGLYAGPVYSRYLSLAKVLDFPPDAMKKIIDRVVGNMGDTPSMHYRAIPHATKPTVKPYVAPVTQPTPEPIPQSPVQAAPVREPVRQVVPLDKILTAIREQGAETRDLMRSQHQELIGILQKIHITPAEVKPADVLHALVDKLFKE